MGRESYVSVNNIEELKNLLEDERISCFNFPAWRKFTGQTENITFPQSYYDLYNKLKEEGLLDKAYIYMMDEPTTEQYDEAIAVTQAFKRDFPGLRQVLPITFSLEQDIVGYMDTPVIKHMYADKILMDKYEKTCLLYTSVFPLPFHGYIYRVQ